MNYGELEAQFGLPSGILNAIRTVESGGGKHLISNAGALGEFQFMPSTAKAYGINPLDPVESANGAARMLSDLGRQYRGNWDAAIAHYNGGSRAGRAVLAGNAPPSPETQAYVPKVRGAMGKPDMSVEDAAGILGFDNKPIGELKVSEAAKLLGLDTRPTAVKAGSALNEVPRQAGLFARHTLEGLGESAQLLTEPIRYITDRLTNSTGKTKPMGMVASDVADWIGLPKPQSETERVVAEGTKLGMGTLGGNKLLTTLAGPASNLLQFGGKGAAPVTQSVAGNIARSMTEGPSQQVTGAAGAGLASAASKEAGGDPVQQTVAGVIGGVGGGLIPGAVNAVTNGVKTAATRLANANMTPQQMDARINLVLQNSGIDFSQLPERARQAVRADLASALKANQDLNPEAVARLAAFRATGLTPTRGMVTQDPVQITREMNLAKMAANSSDGELHGLPRLLNQNNTKLINNLNEAGAVNGDLFTAGVKSINQIGGRDAALKSGVDQLYEKVRQMPGGDIPLDRKTLVDNIYKNLAASNRTAFLPPEVGNMLDTISKGVVNVGGQTHEVPFNANTIDNLMTMIATAQRGTSDGNTKAALSAVRQALESTPITPIKTQFGGNQLVTEAGAKFLRDQDAQAGNVLNAMLEAKNAARQRFGWQESGKPVEAALSGAQPDDFIKKFVIKGSLADAQNLASNTSTSAGVKDALLAHLKDVALNKASDETGKFSQSAFNKELKNIGDRKLSLFFSRDELANLKLNGRVAALMQSQPIGSAVNNSNSGAMVVGKAYDAIRSGLGMVPGIGPVTAGVLDVTLGNPTKNVVRMLDERKALNVLPGLLNEAPKRAPWYQSGVLPAMTVGGLLAAPSVN